jgi:hypothetical protein
MGIKVTLALVAGLLPRRSLTSYVASMHETFTPPTGAGWAPC